MTQYSTQQPLVRPDTERLYIESISPLMEQVIDLCYTNGIPVVFAAQLFSTSEGDKISSYCLTNGQSAAVLQNIKLMLTTRAEVGEHAGVLPLSNVPAPVAPFSEASTSEERLFSHE